jgi:pyruvate formate lyase activating enzyme
MRRRNFLKFSAAAGLTPKKGLLPFASDLFSFSDTANLSKVEARYYKKLPDREIECQLCPRFCKLGDKERGYCGVRENMGGTYYTLVYGKACAVHVDPIEKKPLFHFLPKTTALSIATAGCNVNCKFCQNWEISQVRPEQITHIDLPPESVVQTAEKNNCPSIAYTYSEPVIFFEYMYDTSLEARRKGIKNVVITGAHVNPEPFKDLLEVVDGVKIDLKAFNQDFYTKYVRGKLQPVLDAIVAASQSHVWLEIVYLVIPTLNDTTSEIRQMCRWIKKEIGPDVPLHLSRFYPYYLMKNLPPTPLSTLENLRNTALEEGLNYVYIGNIPAHEAENTYCPHCGEIIVKRMGYLIEKINIKNGRCALCGQEIPGFWS